MNLAERAGALEILGKLLKSLELKLDPGNTDRDAALDQLMTGIRLKNPWFQLSAIHRSVSAWALALEPAKIKDWTVAYPGLTLAKKVFKVGVVNAGNIPLVGLHDLLAVFLSGNNYIGKNSSDDPFLLPWLIDLWSASVPEVSQHIKFADKLTDIDAVIATGSNNTARYFDYYFSKYPNVIRKNRNAVALLNGDETYEQLKSLGKDIFTYYGMGCRNVAKLYIPADYDLKYFFEAMYDFNYVMEHHKYMNNFDYHHAILLMKGIPFLQNNFLIVKEDEAIASPLAVVYYERYGSKEEVLFKLQARQEELQCVVTGASMIGHLTEKGLRPVEFGQSQFPSLLDYADGVDTMSFLIGLQSVDRVK